MRHLIAASLVSLGACAFEPSGPGDPGPGPDPDPPLPADVDAGVTPPPPPPVVDCRAEGGNLGIVGLIVDVPEQGMYRFDSWQVTPAGELVGFTLSGPPEPRYEVRADDDRFEGREMLWVHPQLASGGADAITRVDFCADFGRGD